MAESITLARPYATAVFEVAVSDNALDEWSTALATLAAVTADDKVSSLLKSPMLGAEAQAQALIDICGDTLTDKGRNVVRLLADNRRLVLMPQIAALFETLKANHLKTVDVELSTAYELSDDTIRLLTEALQKRLDRQIALRTRVDQGLIGGAVIRAGDTVIDNSVRGKLKKLADSLNS